MLSINNGFLGYHHTLHNVLFTGSDTEELYQRNLKTQPDDWYYRTNQISYLYNNNGHRCKEISDIDLDNYFLVTGCSHTEGIGLKLEDTWPYLLSQKLNCDYYNLAVGGTGIDVVQYNLLSWLSKIKKPPKFIIVQWPYHVRMVLKDDNIWHPKGIWNTKENIDLEKFFVHGNMLGFFESTRMLLKNLLQNISTSTIINVCTESDQYRDGDLLFKQIDIARDAGEGAMSGHLGVKSQIHNTDLLLSKINN